MGHADEITDSSSLNTATHPSDKEIEGALNRILVSSEFSGADRIQSFLAYVVRETLQGNADRIHAKSILYDVYQRSPEAGHDTMAVVRVDAGRLRRKLAEYYLGTGKEEHVRIQINPGGYVPQFTRLSLPGEPTQTGRSSDGKRVFSPKTIGLGVALAVCLLAFVMLALPGSDRGSSIEGADVAVSDNPRLRAVRDALFAASPARLQAANLAGQARDLLFPALEPRWLQLVLQMFELTIEMDPGYYGGFAGAAQAEALVAVTQQDGAARAAGLMSAKAHLAQAQERGIDQSWTHSAAALVALVSRQFDQARTSSEHALALDPTDAHSVNVDALIALFSGDFERAAEQARKTVNLGQSTTRFPSLSVNAAANIHLQRFEKALRLLNEAKTQGDPISPISLGYLIAANVGQGNIAEARDLVKLLNETWPGYPMENLYIALYREPAHAEDIVSALRTSGWTSN
ncbi:hypothetical protein [Primorskyibacter sp. S87]|uniref:hypothetical protein n=1 Tax=Primorskyibacter sp. S87 TaxID=3415126 RepID=UPI003C7E142A